MTLLRGVEHRLPGDGARAIHAEGGKLVRQRAQQRGVIRFGSARGELPAGPGRKPRAPCDGSNHVRFERNGRRRGCGTGHLRIERADDAVGALGREARRGIEQPEVARMSEMHHAVLEHVDRPVEKLAERSRRFEIEADELLAQRFDIQRRGGGACAHSLLRECQSTGQIVLDLLPVAGRRKQRRNRCANRSIG